MNPPKLTSADKDKIKINKSKKNLSEDELKEMSHEVSWKIIMFKLEVSSVEFILIFSRN